MGCKAVEGRHVLAGKSSGPFWPLVAATVKRKWADEHSLDDVATRELADGVYTRSAMKSSSARVDWWRT